MALCERPFRKVCHVTTRFKVHLVRTTSVVVGSARRRDGDGARGRFERFGLGRLRHGHDVDSPEPGVFRHDARSFLLVDDFLPFGGFEQSDEQFHICGLVLVPLGWIRVVVGTIDGVSSRVFPQSGFVCDVDLLCHHRTVLQLPRNWLSFGMEWLDRESGGVASERHATQLGVVPHNSILHGCRHVDRYSGRICCSEVEWFDLVAGVKFLVFV